ncbi:PREDICTED: putative F-box protein At4g10190 [Camelina sativa]|uniref:F-box protein At4g10190 n=1 Tax=Camelina sativa TaxID=90675 RepID=A0ABM1QG45_CAMSA|nr:PREDICTED: putative F-box protein At4g10190 [Camelina sativa]
MKKTNIVDLPEDLVVEIISRVPAVSLVGLRSTCKRSNALINDASLAKKHYTTAPRHSLIIMLIASRVYLASVDLHNNHNDTIHNNKVKITTQFSLNDPLSDSLEEVNISNIFHCDGLLLCTTVDNRLVVWNPCLREVKWIKPRKSFKRLTIFAFGKSSCNKYKILRMDQFNHTWPVLLDYEIYDFTSNSWRVVGKITGEWFIPPSADHGMSVDGNTYWLACTKDFTSGVFLLGFDFLTERFARVSLPGDNLPYHKLALSVTREDQKLCMLATRAMQPSIRDVWIATKIESTGAASWSKFLSIDVANINKHFFFVTGMNFLVDQENKVLVCRGENGISNVFLHVVGEDKCIQVDHHDAESRCSLVVSYVPTLVQIQQGS